MFKNRFLLVIGMLSLLLATMAVSLPRLDAVIIPVRGAQEARPYIIDSATRSYIAQAKAVTCGVDATYGLDLDSATRSYIAWAKSLEARKSCQ